MNHSFNVDLAKGMGIEEAIIIEQLYWWIHKNECEEDETMTKEGRVWCRSSAKGFSKYIPYMSAQKIRRVLRTLEVLDVIKVGNFNKVATNQTLWYTFTDEFKKVLEGLGYDFSKMKNGMFKNEQSINNLKDKNINIEDNIQEEEKRLTVVNQKKNRFIKPTIEQIQAYIDEKKLSFDAERFFDYYESKGWMIGKNHMKDWKAACRTWENMRKSENKKEEKEESAQEPEMSDAEAKAWKSCQEWMAKKVPGLKDSITYDDFCEMRALAHFKSDVFAAILMEIEESEINVSIVDDFDAYCQGKYYDRIWDNG